MVSECEDVTLGEEIIEEICSDEIEEIEYLKDEIDELEERIADAEETFDFVKSRIRKIVEALRSIKDEFEESYFYEEPPDSDTLDSLDDLIEELEKLLDIAL